MDSVQTWIIVGIVAVVGLWLLHTIFHSIGNLIKWGITLAVLIALFGWGAVAEVPGKIWDWMRNIGTNQVEVRINGQPVKCSVIPSVSDAQTLLNKARPSIDSVLGKLSTDVVITVVNNPDCTGKAALEIKSSTVESINQIKSGIQTLLPNLPINVLPK